MIFEYYGIIESETAIRLKCKTKLSGTHPVNVISCCQSYGLESYIEFSDLDGLKSLLHQGIPPIVNVFKIETDIWYVHSVIVTKIRQNQIEIVDPEDGVLKIPIDKFDELWGYSNRVVIAVTKNK